ncbi:YifB family Mg chelatase-like AAA ATPase [Microbulbifer hydrolyticus]|uniref:Magnesium chelatase family protein n=1 Tax=Microbulbifer hydrolyticus TaxID=48074 RepID=A0A6P1TI54_9GAMM|nr:YifB family Mg chelatase-like AAA ATPase [Microbulbifer hydrolyticus]MBB5211915.1 magnesium chelatase family protein [Microbulbifer hydrolyticus]QHQ40502.1 YifB family Mg chelatase-like AAA ATPase [Microbulbifer hydrolyticus]
MSLSITYARAQLGIQAPLVTVETHLANGLPAFNIVGLPEAAVRESRDRVRSAIVNSHFEFPQRRITVNLAPADLPKAGGRYDLAIALGILAASGQVPGETLESYEFIGELALSGSLRPIPGALPAAMACRDSGRTLVTDNESACEAALIATPIKAASTLLQVCAQLHGREPLPDAVQDAEQDAVICADLADVRGQLKARRALEVAAAGSHNLLFYGPPGTGKTMLASRLPGILPPLTDREMIEVAALYSSAGLDRVRQRPFRAPHHSASPTALVGGGSNPRPGEISLAHRGVLFLDEMPEFPRSALEILREPLENGEVRISRARAQVTFPADFQLVAAMNPCPCGYLSEPRCRCTPDQIDRYRRKLSGPLLDRIDMQVEVASMSASQLQDAPAGESSKTVRERVRIAREIQLDRQKKINGELAGAELDEFCQLGSAESTLLRASVEKLGLSARSYHRVLKVARTLADLCGRKEIGTGQIAEALAYRNLDRKTVMPA